MSNNKITLNDVIDAVYANLATLRTNSDYTLEQLTGLQFWATLSSGQRKRFGIQFKAYAAQGGAMVAWNGTTSCHKQLYRLT